MAVARSKVRIILGEDSDVSLLYPLDESCEIRFQDSIPFINEPTDFFFQTEKDGLNNIREIDGFRPVASVIAT